MMKTIKLLIVLSATLVLAWLLPWLYHFAFNKPSRTPFTLYSCVTESFCSINFKSDSMVYMDNKGRFFSEEQFDSILPTFYYRQLVADERFPDSIRGVAVSPKLFQHENFNFRYSPSDHYLPQLELYPLINNRTGKLNLVMPSDIFRIHETIEFINIETNSVDNEKSRLFQACFDSVGFKFPAKYVKGNPTTRKEYDNGYFIVDANNEIFHLILRDQKPILVRTSIDSKLEIQNIIVTEFANRQAYGFCFDKNNRIYQIEVPTYRLKEIPLTQFNPMQHNLTIIGDMFYWNIKISDSNREQFIAMDAHTFKAVDSLAFEKDANRNVVLVSQYVFPFKLSFRSATHEFFKPELAAFSPKALALGFVLSLASYFIYRRKRQSVIPAVASMLFGVFGFCACLLFFGQKAD